MHFEFKVAELSVLAFASFDLVSWKRLNKVMMREEVVKRESECLLTLKSEAQLGSDEGKGL